MQVERIPPAFPPGSGQAQRQLRDYVRTLEAQEAEQAKETGRQALSSEREVARKSDCTSLREQRFRLEKPRQLQYQSDGSARRLTEEERQTHILDIEGRIAEVCS